MIDELGRVWGRLINMVRFGQVSNNPDETQNVQQMQVQFSDIEMRENVQSVQFFGLASSPMPGASVVVFNPSGYSGNGVILGTHDPRYRPTGLAAGETKIHDAFGQYVYLDGGGTIHIIAGQKVVVTCNTEVDITAPTLNVMSSSQVNIQSNDVGITAPTITLTGTVNVVGNLLENGIHVVAP